MTKPSLRDFLTNLDQPMPLSEKLAKLSRNLWRRVILRHGFASAAVMTANPVVDAPNTSPVRRNTNILIPTPTSTNNSSPSAKRYALTIVYRALRI
jgi:hypothetical protein